MNILLILIFMFSWLMTFFIFPFMIPRLKKAGITGKNMHSPDREEVPEMGGLVLVAGFSSGIILTIFIKIFYKLLPEVSLNTLLACLSTVLIVSLIGIFDDLVSMNQITKAFMPIFAALPLVSVEIADTTMNLQFLGYVDFGIYYPLILLPLGVTGAANAFNMLAGFNGLEVGLGIISMVTVIVISLITHSMTALVIALSCLGALLAAIYYNWYPAKILIGDIGTLSIGAILAVCVVVGDFETAGFILIIPFIFDFVIKARYRFPYTFGKFKNGKLYCPEEGPKGLAQWILKISGGLKESHLVIVLFIIEILFGLLAISVYL